MSHTDLPKKADDAQQLVEYLKMVQSIIVRMSDNSARAKTWAISLVSASFIFSGLSENPHWLIGVGGLFGIFVFWIMDAQYLYLERCYRKLFKAAVDKEINLFNLDYRPYAKSISRLQVVFSWSVLLFYGALATIMVLLVIFIVFMCG